MPHDSIGNKLKDIKRWSFIPGKNKILPVIEKRIDNDEYIIDLLDGFFPENDEIKNGGDSGLILVTDRRILLIRSELPESCILINKDKIKSIICNKKFFLPYDKN